MSANPNTKVAELLKPLLKRRLFAALNKTLVSSEEMAPYVVEHLEATLDSNDLIRKTTAEY